MSKKAVPFIVTGIVMMLFGITMVLTGTINNFLSVEFKADKLYIGMCAAILAFGILTGTITFGPVADRYGYKPVMLAGIILVGTGLYGITAVSDLPGVPFLFFVLGAGGGMLNGVTNVVVARLFPSNSSAWLSLLGVFYTLGALGLPLITSIMLTSGFDYRKILVWVSLSLTVPFLLVVMQKFPEPKHMQSPSASDYGKIFTHRAILLIGMFLFFQSGIEMVVSVWTPTYLMESFGTTYDRALYAITAGALGMMAARLILARILKPDNSLRILFISLLLATTGILLLCYSGTFISGLASVALLSIGLSASFPVMLGLTASFFPESSGTAFSMVLSLSLAGNMILNALTGYLLRQYGTGSLIPQVLVYILFLIVFLWFIYIKLVKNKLYAGNTMAK